MSRGKAQFAEVQSVNIKEKLQRLNIYLALRIGVYHLGSKWFLQRGMFQSKDLNTSEYTLLLECVLHAVIDVYLTRAA